MQLVSLLHIIVLCLMLHYLCRLQTMVEILVELRQSTYQGQAHKTSQEHARHGADAQPYLSSDGTARPSYHKESPELRYVGTRRLLYGRRPTILRNTWKLKVNLDIRLALGLRNSRCSLRLRSASAATKNQRRL